MSYNPRMMLSALRLAAALAFAAFPREAEREQAVEVESQAFRFTDGFFGAGQYVANRGNAAARPDGSGAARSRYQLFLRDRASADQVRLLAHGVFLTDRAGSLFRLASLDYYLGLTRHADSGGWVGVGRGEALPLDRKGLSRRFWDLRVGTTRSGGPVRSGLYAGWFFKNDGRPARPDHSGEALFKYTGFLHLSPKGPFRARLEADFLTDERRRRYRPVSVDVRVELAARREGSELAVAWEPWYMLDRRGVAEAWTVTYVFRFDSRTPQP